MTITVTPVFRLDFNQTKPGGVWTTVGEFEISTWRLCVGSAVIVEDFDEPRDLRFQGTVTALKPGHAPGRWRMEVDFD